MTHDTNLIPREAELLLYQTEDGRTRVEVRLDGDTAWMSLTQMAELFQRDKSVISRHIKNVFTEGELVPKATVANYATVQREGNREVTRDIEYYSLDVVIAVRSAFEVPGTGSGTISGRSGPPRHGVTPISASSRPPGHGPDIISGRSGPPRHKRAHVSGRSRAGGLCARNLEHSLHVKARHRHHATLSCGAPRSHRAALGQPR